MIEQTQKRTIKDLQQIIIYFETIYQSFHSKSTSVLRILKQTSKQLSLVHPKGQYFNLLAFFTEIHQKIWATSSSRILKLEDNHPFYLTLKDRMKQFQQEYQFSINSISETQKDISILKSMHGELEKVYQEFQKPIRYYNNIDRLDLKKQLKEKLEEYLSKKAVFMVDYPSKKKVISHIHHITEWFNKQIDEGLMKGLSVINRIQDGFLSGIRQFIYYIIDTCTRQISKLQKVETESYWIIEYKQLKNENLMILTKLHQDSSQHLESSFQKYFKYCKQISKTLEEEIRYSEMLISQMKTMIEVLNSTKRQVEKELNYADTFKEKVSKYCNDPNFSQCYKLTLVEVIHIINITISNISQHYELAKTLDQMNIKKKEINYNIKTILGRQITKTPQNIASLYEQKLNDLQVLDQLEKQSNVLMKKSILTSLKKYVQDIKNTEIILISGYKQLRRNKQEITMVKTDLVKQVLKIDLLNDNDLQKQIAKSLQQFPSFTASDEENPDKVYNCALAGKILLLGKLKLFPELILFQSKFNNKNILFGKTNLVVPINEIIECTKESVMLIDNAINIHTNKGIMTFTSFYNRDKVLEELNQYLLEEQEQKTVKNEQNVIEQQSVIETFTPEEREMIQKKRGIYPKSLFQPYQVDAGTIVMQGTNIRKVFKEIYANSNPMVKKRQKYSGFKEYALLSTQNSQVTMNDFKPLPPSYFDQTSPSKLSQLESSTRVVTYKHHLDSIPIPFMPKFGNVTETEVFHWVSDKMIVIEGENATRGPPYSDTFVLKFRTIIEQQDGKVKIKGSGTIHFFTNPTFKGIIKSTGEKQIVKNTGLVLKLTQQHMKQTKNKRKNKSNNQQKVEQIVEQVEEQVQNQTESFDDKLQKINWENKKNLIIISSVFVLVLFLTHILF